MKTPGVYGRAVALVLGVALPPVIALGAILVEQNQHALRVDADQTHVLLAELAAVIVEKEVAEAQRVVESIAETALKPENGTTEAENMASLSRVFAEHSALLAVTLYDANGARRATLRPEGDGTEGPQTLPEALRGDAPRLVRVGPGAVGLAVPAEQGWAYGVVDFSAVTEQLRRFGLRPPLRAADAVSLVDGAGRLLAGETTDTAAVMSALGDDPGFVTKPLSIATEFERDDQAMLGAVVTLPRLGWAVVVQRPRAQAYESLRELRAAVAAAVLLSVLLATVATLFAVRRLTHPIALLTRATRELAERRCCPRCARAAKRTPPGSTPSSANRCFATTKSARSNKPAPLCCFVTTPT